MASDKEIPSSSMDTYESDDEEMLEEDNLYLKFRKLIGYKICFPEQQQQGTHIADIPQEMFLKILKLVAGPDMDNHKMLDVCASVCRGWYCCARDNSLYHAACSKMWVVNEADLEAYGGSWRQMYFERPFVYTHGCYVAIVDDPKPSEHRYIYLKFYTGDRVIYHSTNIKPEKMLKKFKNLHLQSCKLPIGRYTLTKNNITMSFHTHNDRKRCDGYFTNLHSPDCTFKVYEIPGHSTKLRCKVTPLTDRGMVIYKYAAKPKDIPPFKFIPYE